jgi:hypothetical protein
MDQGTPINPEIIDPGKLTLQKLDFYPAQQNDADHIEMNARYTTADQQVFLITARYAVKDQEDETIRDLLANMEVGFNITRLDSLPPVENNAPLELGDDVQQAPTTPEEGGVTITFMAVQPNALPGMYQVDHTITSRIRERQTNPKRRTLDFPYGENGIHGALSINVKVSCDSGTQINGSVYPGNKTPNPTFITPNQLQSLIAGSKKPTILTVSLSMETGKESFTMRGTYTHT